MVDTFRAQPGPQTAFLRTPADFAVYGGAAGGGKTYGLLLEAGRHVDNPGYRGTIFRRTSPQITAGGGLWDAASAIYPRVGATANISGREWRFRSGAKLAFRHLQHESSIYDWQGAELGFLGFDELTHFSERQVFYLFSRLRTTCGIRPYARATVNPDAGSWVKGFLQWWIDPATGYPIPERAGMLRWFYRVADDIRWYGSKGEAEEAHPDLSCDAPPMSATFVPAKLSDNAILCAADPSYRAKLKALSWVERARLEDGNWNATASDGLFRAEWFPEPVPPEHLPATWRRRVRAWDLAATVPKDGSDPDYLSGVLMGAADATPPRYYLLHVERARVSPLKVERLIEATAERDGKDVEILIEQEPGAAGKILASQWKDKLQAKGYAVVIVRPDKQTGDKVARAYPFSAACERGEVIPAAGPWVRPWLAELVQFPAKGVHDDQVDSSAAAYSRLARGGVAFAVASRG